MSLIERTVRQEPTKEEKLVRVGKRIKNMSKRLNDDIAKKHSNMFNIVWHNGAGLTPQEVLTEIGTDAGELFSYSTSIQTLLAGADPDYVVLETPNEYVINGDGTVTVGAAK